jgi:hypothetical protein
MPQPPPPPPPPPLRTYRHHLDEPYARRAIASWTVQVVTTIMVMATKMTAKAATTAMLRI